MGLLNISFPWQIQAQEETGIISWRECSKKSVQSCPEPLEGKAAAILTRGAYMEYVSTAKWRPACAKPLRPLARKAGFSGEREGRERRWRLFPIFPRWSSYRALKISRHRNVLGKPKSLWERLPKTNLLKETNSFSKKRGRLDVILSNSLAKRVYLRPR